MIAYCRKHPSSREVLAYARRLREELAKLSGVKLVPLSGDPKVIHSARVLAKDIRKTVQAATKKQSLDDTMRQLRGRSSSY
jgi:hypothetical protein